MIRFLFLVLLVSLCITHQLPAAEKGAVGQFNYPNHLPENTYYPVYPGYPVYRRHVEGKLYTAKDYWAARREAFKEGNRKGVGSAMEHGSEQIREERNKRYERDVQVAKDVLGTNQTDKSLTQNSQTSSTTQSASTPLSTTGQPVPPPVEEPPSQPTGTSRRPIFDTSSKAASIKAILDEQVGVAYSSDGEEPGDGFSPVGLIKHVARRIGVVPDGINNAADLWEKAGLFIQSRYGA